MFESTHCFLLYLGSILTFHAVAQHYTAGQREDFYNIAKTGTTLIFKTCPPLNKSDVKLMLFTPEHRNIPVPVVRKEDVENNVRWIFPGWTTPLNETFLVEMKNAFLDKYNGSVIMLNWLALSETERFGFTYCMLPKVARYLARLIATSGIDLRGDHQLIGHSLGGHLVGQIGRYYYRYTGRKPFRLTAIDPGGPGNYYQKCSSRWQACKYIPTSAAIRPTDGEFVDVYHAASGTSSTPVKSGHVDFYIDECGVRICTCPVVQNLISPLNMTIDVIGQAACSHDTIPVMYVDTIRNNELYKGAKRCDGCKQFVNGFCDSGRPVQMGDNVSRNLRGKHYIVVSQCNLHNVKTLSNI